MSDNNLDDQLRELIADVLEILARIGRTFDVEIPQDELSRMVNLESVRAIVQAHAKA
mgnify:FL=1